MSEHRGRVRVAMGAGIVGVSFAAVLVRLADASPAAVAALRLVFSTALLLPAAAASPGFRAGIVRLGNRDRLLILLSGLMLALHFGLWIASLSLTGVASSVVFVTTNPLFVTVFSLVFFRERVPGAFWLGLGLAAAGALVIGWGDLSGSRMSGNLLAIGGAVAAAVYFLVGGRLRRRLPLLVYIVPVYAVAALSLAAWAVASGISPGGLGRRVYLFCFLMALVSQIGGHTLFNWALEHVSARVVAAATLGEPVGASLLALLVLGERPGAAEMIGGSLVLAGLYVSIARGAAAVSAGIRGRPGSIAPRR